MGMAPERDTELIAKWIVLDRRSARGDEARVVEYGVPVWALIGHLPAAQDDVVQVALDYALPVEAVRAAIAYYTCHREAIDARLALNASAVS